MEREVDPILMQYRDAQKEKEFQQTLSSRKKTKVNKMAGQKFNIITHQGHKAPTVELERKFRGTREYNLLSHYPNKFHKEAPTQFDEGYYLACSRPVTTTTSTSNVRARDFNILSNKYKDRDEERRLEDHEKMQEHMRTLYWQTHIFDPIRGEMFDEKKEKVAREAEALRAEQRMRRKEDRLPPRYQTAEGHTYNILTQAITKPSKFCAIEEKSLHRYRGREELLRTTLQRSQELQELEQQRRLNRISYARYAHTAERGYDFVFPDAKMSLGSVPSPPGSVWDRLQMDGGGGGRSGTTRPRNVSGPTGPSQGALSPFSPLPSPQRPSSESRGHSSGAADVSARNVSTAAATTRISTRVPSLELTRADCGSPVSYQEPTNAAPGQLIPIVRTGGLGSMVLSP